MESRNGSNHSLSTDNMPATTLTALHTVNTVSLTTTPGNRPCCYSLTNEQSESYTEIIKLLA